MNPDAKKSELPEVSGPDFAEPPLPSSVDSLLLPPQEPNPTNEQLKQVMEQVKAVLSSLPEYVSDFFSEYKRPLVTLGLIFAGVVTVKLTLAMLDAVDDIPLLAPTFELIGFGYTIWFVYRYLLKANNRQELSKEIEEIKDQIVGKLPK